MTRRARLSLGLAIVFGLLLLVPTIVSAFVCEVDPLPRYTQPCYHCYFHVRYYYDYNYVTPYWWNTYEMSRANWNSKPTAPILDVVGTGESENVASCEWIEDNSEGRLFPYKVAGSGTPGLMHHWVAFVNRHSLQTTSQHYDQSVTGHEMGHAQGMGHLANYPSLMYDQWFNGDIYWTAQPADVELLRLLYPLS
jgi:hypothetical protein